MATMSDLDVLIGSWRISGRTDSAMEEDISGTLTAVPLLDGRMLSLTGTMKVGGQAIESLELIWQDPAHEGFQAQVHSGTSAPLDYRWDRDGSTLLHAGLGMTYTGTISEDGATIAGRWSADPDHPEQRAQAYDATMYRVG